MNRNLALALALNLMIYKQEQNNKPVFTETSKILVKNMNFLYDFCKPLYPRDVPQNHVY